jgi:putative FmdB family regulatory protein
MPTYDYKCDECGVIFERFQHFSDDPLTVCPECCGALHRVIYPVGVIFKGKGFYVTDNRGKSSTLPVTDEKKAESASDAAPVPASDAKPASESKSASAEC